MGQTKQLNTPFLSPVRANPLDMCEKVPQASKSTDLVAAIRVEALDLAVIRAILLGQAGGAEIIRFPRRPKTP